MKKIIEVLRGVVHDLECIELDRQVRTDANPWHWLAHPVYGRGGEYVLVSPAGGRCFITDDQRRRIVACLEIQSDHTTEALENYVSRTRKV